MRLKFDYTLPEDERFRAQKNDMVSKLEQIAFLCEGEYCNLHLIRSALNDLLSNSKSPVVIENVAYELSQLNTKQMKYLSDGYQYGVRAHHLLSPLLTRDNNFSPVHADTLISLLRNKQPKIAVEKVLLLIGDLTISQCKELLKTSTSIYEAGMDINPSVLISNQKIEKKPQTKNKSTNTRWLFSVQKNTHSNFITNAELAKKPWR